MHRLAIVALLFAAAVSAVDPPVSENMLTWLDPMASNAFVLASDGIHVQQWTDQSPRAKHFVQTDPTKQPLRMALAGPEERRRRDDCDYGCGTGNGTMTGSGGSIGSSPYRRRSTGTVAVAHIFIVAGAEDDTESSVFSSLFKVVGSTGRAFLDLGNMEFAGGAGTAFAVSVNALANAATAVSSNNVLNPFNVWTVAIEPQMGWSTRVTIYKNNAFLSSTMLLGVPPYGLTHAILAESFNGVVAEVLVYSDMNADGRVATTQYLCEKHYLSC